MNYYNRLIILIISVLSISCSDDETSRDDLQRLPDFYTVTFFDRDSRMLSNNLSIVNGASIDYDINSNINTTGDSKLLELKNFSNDKVQVIKNPLNRLHIYTDEIENQEVKFDIYYDGKKIESMTIAVKVSLKLQKKGVDIVGDLSLDFRKALPQELKIVKANGMALETFDKRYVQILDIENNPIENYEIFSGDNLRIYFNASEKLGNEFKAIINYVAPEFDYQSIHVKTIKVKTAGIADNCEIITEKFVVSNSVGNAINRDFEFLIQDGVIKEFRGLYERKRRNKVFYDKGKIVEIINRESGIAKAIYKYEDGLITTSILKDYSGTNNTDYFTYYYTDKKLTAITHERFSVFSDQPKGKDSIVYENYIDNHPQRKIEYNSIPDQNFHSTLYFKLYYDTSNNIIKEEVSKDDLKYVLSKEERFDPVETVTEYFNWETGETFVKRPLSISSTYYTNSRGDVKSPSFYTIKNINKDDNGRITSIENRYVGNDTVDGETNYLLTFTYDACDE